MAIFKLGAIVTAIVGSIGGTTFKRGVGNPIVHNKSFGFSRAKLLNNKQLNNIRNIFQAWKSLDDTFQSNWVAEALNFQFPDKFGVMRNLTGRQFFTKQNIHLMLVGLYVDDPSGISSTVQNIDVSSPLVNYTTQEASVDIFVPSGSTNIIIQAEVRNGALNSPTYTRREILVSDTVSGTITFDFGGQFFAKYPYFGETYNCRLYIKAMNDFGFQGSPIVAECSIVG